MIANPLDNVSGVQVETAGSLGLADSQASRDYRGDQPQGRRDGEGEAVGYPEPDQPYCHLLVAGGGEEDHARDHGDGYALCGSKPVEQGLPLHEEKERRPSASNDGPQDGGHDENHKQDDPDAPEVHQGFRQIPEAEHEREHTQHVEWVQENER